MIKNDPSVIVPTFKHLKSSFRTGKTLDVNFRREQLLNFLRGLKELNDKFCTALEKDLGVNREFSMLLNTQVCVGLTQLTLDKLSTWVKPVPVDTPLLIAPAKSYLVPEPLGVVLCLGTWNYPMSTVLPYVAAAIAAGNCVVLKPSELAPHSSVVMAELFEYLDKDFYRCIEGEVEVAVEIIKQRWDLIVFTGAPEKGKLIAQEAAKNLIPCIFELGGKCPTVVNTEADLNSAAIKIARARFLNAGQTCLACDYVFVHKEVKSRFLELLKEKVRQFYGDEPFNSRDYSKVINVRHTERLKSYLDENHGGKVLLGGDVKLNDRYVAPTIVDNPRVDSKMMKDEIFGPILPVYEFTDIEEVIDFINDREKPLSAYYYGSAKSDAFKQMKVRTSSGSLVCNESFMQVINANLPFGGVGESGMGKLMGYSAFKSMSHMKSILEANNNISFPNSAFFPPFNSTTEKLAVNGMKVINWNQRHAGNVIKTILILVILFLLFTYWTTVLKTLEGGRSMIGIGHKDL